MRESYLAEQPSQLAVRSAQRFSCEVAAFLAIAPEHTKLLRLAPLALSAKGLLPTVIADYSSGGLGLRLPLYLPLGSLLRVTLGESPGAIGAIVRVQRAVMVDRVPNYYLGTAFKDQAAGQAFYAAMRSSHSDGRYAA